MFEWNPAVDARANMEDLWDAEVPRANHVALVIDDLKRDGYAPGAVYAELRSAVAKCKANPLWIDWVTLLYLALPCEYREAAFAMVRGGVAQVASSAFMEVVGSYERAFPSGAQAWDKDVEGEAFEMLGDRPILEGAIEAHTWTPMAMHAYTRVAQACVHEKAWAFLGHVSYSRLALGLGRLEVLGGSAAGAELMVSGAGMRTPVIASTLGSIWEPQGGG